MIDIKLFFFFFDQDIELFKNKETSKRQEETVDIHTWAVIISGCYTHINQEYQQK